MPAVKTAKLSTLFRDAADYHLKETDELPLHKAIFSCCAITLGAGQDIALQRRAIRFVKELGCHIGSVSAFKSVPRGTERQSARHMWLYFAALIAEEEGL